MKQIGTLLLALLLLSAPVLAEEIVIATEGANPPYNDIDEDGEIIGFERELGDALCKRLNVECLWVAIPTDALIPGLIAGDFTAVLAAGPIDQDHGPDVAITQPYLYPDIYAVVGPAGSELKFGTGTVAVLQDRDLSAWGAESGRSLIEFGSIEAAVEAVKAGQVDAVLAKKELLTEIVVGSAGTLDFVYDDKKFVSGVGVVFRASDADLRFRFEDAIFEMNADGTLGDLAKKWFGEGVATN